MSRKIGNICIILGTALLLGALSLSLHNRSEDEAARQASNEHLAQLVQMLSEANPAVTDEGQPEPDWLAQQVLAPKDLLTEEDLKMTETVIDGYAYIGYLSMPTLGLELPVLSDWDYTKLNIAPCRYHGTLRGEDLVIMAHNYSCHFGPISRLQEGDEVLFVDMDGILTRYQVVGSDILNPFSSREITAGLYDLTLFTCTYGGKSRVTVYCNREK